MLSIPEENQDWYKSSLFLSIQRKSVTFRYVCVRQPTNMCQKNNLLTKYNISELKIGHGFAGSQQKAFEISEWNIQESNISGKAESKDNIS